MNNLLQTLSVELLKVRRSKMPLWTLLGFCLAPLAGGFFMMVMKDPDLARRMGMISAKAHFLAGSADWQTFLGILAQATAIGGQILFAFVTSWVFGREYSDHTIKDLLALPTPRSNIVTSKFIVILLWCSILTGVIYLLGLLVGVAVGLPRVEAHTIAAGSRGIAVTACLTMLLLPPVAWLANVGRGYLSPMGGAVFALVLAQVVAAAGWGEYFPWSIPALYAGMAGPQSAQLGATSFSLLLLTAIIGFMGTGYYWKYADQT
jgi:ABC-2 type transport system permease protein